MFPHGSPGPCQMKTWTRIRVRARVLMGDYTGDPARRSGVKALVAGGHEGVQGGIGDDRPPVVKRARPSRSTIAGTDRDL